MSARSARLKQLRSYPEYQLLLELVKHQVSLAQQAEGSQPLDVPAEEFLARVAFLRGQRLAWEAALRLVDDAITYEDEIEKIPPRT